LLLGLGTNGGGRTITARLYFLKTDSGPWGPRGHSVEILQLEVFDTDVGNLAGGRIKMGKKSLQSSIVRRSQFGRTPCKFELVEEDHEVGGI
jgi:hypothetical protein